MAGDSHKRKHSSSDEETDSSDKKIELKKQRSGDLKVQGAKSSIDVKNETETLPPKPESSVEDKTSEAKTLENESLSAEDGPVDTDKSQKEEKTESAHNAETDKISGNPEQSGTTTIDENTTPQAIDNNEVRDANAEIDANKEDQSALSKDDGDKESVDDTDKSETPVKKAAETKVFGSGFTSKAENGSDKDSKEPIKSVFGSVSNTGKSASTGSVFGSGAVFGASSWSSSSMSTKNVFAELDLSGSSSPSTSASSNGKVFGSGSVFGASSTPLSAGETKNIFESLPDKKEEEEKVSSSVVGEQKEDNPELQVREVETGEESEESVYSCRAKLYALDVTAEQIGWKERGVGTLHVNNSTESADDKKRSRIVMRSDGSLRVILNVLLTPKTEIQKGLKSSFASEKFVRLTGVEDGKPIQYAIKTGNANIGEELYEAIQKLISL